MLAFHPFTADDVEQAARLYVACFNAPPWDDDWSADAAERRLETLLQFPGAIGLISTSSTKMVGLAIGHCEPWADGLHYYLNEICVESEAQRNGVGEALLDEICKTLRAEGVSSVYLLTEISTAAESFFRKQGFEADEVSVKLWRDV